mgnify:CR=1 FL=1
MLIVFAAGNSNSAGNYLPGAMGIEVVGVKLTNVKLPMELQQRLEKTTSFKTRIEEDAKEHQHNVLKLENGNYYVGKTDRGEKHSKST